MKPLFKYPGGKTRELKNIRLYYPKDETKIFVEPFLGAGAVYWDFNDADEYHINDISSNLIGIYSFLANEDKTFISTLKKMAKDWDNLVGYSDNINYKFDVEKYNWFYERKSNKMSSQEASETAAKSAYFVKIRERFNSEKNQNKKSAYYLFIMTYAFSSLFQYNLKGELNIPYGGKGYNNKSFNKVIKRMMEPPVMEKLKKTKFYNEDFEIFLKRFIRKKNTFVFLDPPYVSDMIYNGSTFSEDSQRRLAKITSKLENPLSVIGEDKLIKDIYTSDFYLIEKKEIKFSISFKNRNETNKYNLYITKK